LAVAICSFPCIMITVLKCPIAKMVHTKTLVAPNGSAKNATNMSYSLQSNTDKEFRIVHTAFI